MASTFDYWKIKYSTESSDFKHLEVRKLLYPRSKKFGSLKYPTLIEIQIQ